MAFSTKYRAEFYDIKGLEWRWDFELDPFVGDITTMQASGDPGTYEPLSDSDDVLENPMRGTKATLRVKSISLFQYREFYTMTPLKMRCSIYHGAAHTLFFRGYVTPYSFSEPYDDYPYDVEISVNCGLGALREIKYEQSEGVPYTGRKTESQVLLDILGKIGATTFTEIVNIYETRMATAVTDSPIDQTYIDVSVFDELYCADVLEILLGKWLALIRQRDGVFVVYRPTEMITTAYARTFTAATTKTDSEITSIASLKRLAAPTADLRDVNGGPMNLLPAVKKMFLEQDYGYKESWLSNHKFPGDSYSNTTYLFDNWTPVGPTTSFIPVANSITKEVEGAMFLYDIGATVPNPSIYLYQNFGTFAKATSELIGFSFDYRMINPTGAAVASVDVCVEISAIGSNHWVDLGADDLVCTWETTQHYINFTVASVPKGGGDWTTFNVTIPGLPVAGPYRIKLFATNKGIFLAYRDVRFASNSDEIIVRKRKRFRVVWNKKIEGKRSAGLGFLFGRHSTREYVDNPEIVGRTYEVTNAIEGIELTNGYLLGDVTDTNITNVIEQFRGSLGLYITGSLAQTAADFVLDHAADYVAGSVTVTNDGVTIVFTSSLAGTDFTGASSIANVTGNLAGSVAATRANAASQAQIDTVTLTSTGGTAEITCGLLTRLATYDLSRATTAINFVADWAADYTAIGITIDAVGDTITFTADVAGNPFAGTTEIVNITPSLAGTVAHTQANITGVARIDTITLTGTSGTANITVDGVTRLATFNTGAVFDHTTNWNTRGGSENDPLLEIIGGEIGDQTSAPRQLLGLPIYDLTDNDINPHVDVIGCFQDDLNKIGDQAIIFAFNRGVFNMKHRHWDIDMVEIGLGPSPGNTLLNDDGTPISNADGSNIETN